MNQVNEYLLFHTVKFQIIGKLCLKEFFTWSRTKGGFGLDFKLVISFHSVQEKSSVLRDKLKVVCIFSCNL